jgi:hypothetical protein
MQFEEPGSLSGRRAKPAAVKTEGRHVAPVSVGLA